VAVKICPFQFHMIGQMRDVLQVAWELGHYTAPKVASNFGPNSNGRQNSEVLGEILGVHNLSPRSAYRRPHPGPPLSDKIFDGFEFWVFGSLLLKAARQNFTLFF